MPDSRPDLEPDPARDDEPDPTGDHHPDDAPSPLEGLMNPEEGQNSPASDAGVQPPPG